MPGGDLIGIEDAEHRVIIHRRSCRQAILLASKYGDNVHAVTMEESPEKSYPITFSIKAIDRYHLLVDMRDHISNVLGLNIDSVTTTTTDHIVDMRITFFVHSVKEMLLAKQHIYQIHGADEVLQV